VKLEIFKEMEKHGHEQVIFNYDKKTGLKAIICIHDTTLGPALGGCRMWPYASEAEALIDALRLSKGMTYKCAIADTDHGGGKTVIIGNPKKDKSEGLFRALGRYVQALNGRYYTGTDVGTTAMDFVYAARECDYIVALPEEYGGSGNSAIPTAYGVYLGIKASVKEKLDRDSLEDIKIAVQGLGKVGCRVVRHLVKERAEVVATDINKENVERAKHDYPAITIVEPDEIYDVECDVFSPNALGAVINDETVERLKCKIVAGAANNQLAEPRHGDILHEKGILYAPDYVINAGGLIQVADELIGYNHERVMKKTEEIYNILMKVYRISKEKNIPTYKAADTFVEERLETIAAIKKTYVKNK